MVGIAQGLIASYKTTAAASGKRCTSADVSLGCCKTVNVCADPLVGSGATCTPIAAQGPSTWDFNC